MLVFPANNEGYRKRRRALRACNECKRRRKRCEPPFKNHQRCSRCTRDSLSCSLVYENEDHAGEEHEEPIKRKAQKTSHHDDGAVFGELEDSVAVEEEGKSSSDFIAIGDLNPASLLLARERLSFPEADSEDVVIWVKKAHLSQKQNPDLAVYLNSNSVKAFDLPPKNHQDAFVKLYFESVHPLLPILDEKTFMRLYAKDEAPILLIHTVILVASKHPKAEPYLEGRTARQFAESIHTKVKAVLYAEGERDRLTLIRSLALLSLHAEGPDGLEGSSSHLSAAIQYAQTVGIHLKRKVFDVNVNNLWWSLWCLDRLSACMNGRPIVIREEDVTTPRPNDTDTWRNFNLMLKLFESLDAVIGMYRPRANEKGYIDIPCVSWNIQDYLHLGSQFNEPIENKSNADFLEILYNAIIVLVHRPRYNGANWDSADPMAIQVVAAQRLAAANRIIELMSNDTILPPIPVVTYAVSLAMTVFYWEFRINPEGARSRWIECCAILKTLGPAWWVAESMGVLGRTVLQKLEKVPVAERVEQANVAPVDPGLQQLLPTENWQPGFSFFQPEDVFDNGELFAGLDMFNTYLMVPEMLQGQPNAYAF